ncbi:uncharacterized protein BJ171DRAFT_489597 [Polychytrium aggregatum]|uniref:uncharacterized protein n=1 Tax=Polychytrium aggregatum TaxID=110093 RepID=UPI0022FED5BA|nr:uncharacterized protein BJ171DRAFT_489597 [Polychytrium aggregatum]KAI9208660.1 hypothetical protein BJ171DRAFT_489597 [Polychytrium aggregatum]
MSEMKPIQISPMPIVDPELTAHDRPALKKASDAFYKEQLIRLEEIGVLRDKLRWCYHREGVNHYKNCRELAQQYIDMMSGLKDGFVVPFPKALKDAQKSQ